MLLGGTWQFLGVKYVLFGGKCKFLGVFFLWDGKWRILVGNYGFWGRNGGFWAEIINFWAETKDFGRKCWILGGNARFWPEIADFWPEMGAESASDRKILQNAMEIKQNRCLEEARKSWCGPGWNWLELVGPGLDLGPAGGADASLSASRVDTNLYLQSFV